jgi:ribonuclease J
MTPDRQIRVERPGTLQEPPPLPPDTLRIVPLGGLGEFGKNTMAMEFGDDLILVDCGMMFPEEDMLGVDAVIPDFGYVADRAHKLRALILTHGHEDHIGATGHFVREFTAPIYGSPLTLALVQGKLAEMGLENRVDLVPVAPRERIRAGAFEIEFLQVAHSIPQTYALAITLPIGTVIHTGDYKFDPSDESGDTDLFSLARYGESGVLLLLADSTNADRRGHSPGEAAVRDGLRPILTAAEGTVILSTFSSGLHRLQTVLSLAEELGRKVFLAGYSLERNFQTATRLGLLRYHDGTVLPFKDIDRFDKRSRILMVTGSQGEPLSVLSRMARDDFRGYRVSGDDTVIFSARMIPGNERAIYRMINHFYRRGARVITERDGLVHASGHAYEEEMLQLYGMLKPRCFVPIHGELRQLIGNAALALRVAVDADGIFILENGDVFDLAARSARQYCAGEAGDVLVDGKIFDQVEEVVLRDRKHLAEDGMIIVILAIDKKTLEITAGPDIVTRGFVEVDRNERLIEDCKAVVIKAFEECEKESKEEWEVVKTTVRKALRKFLRVETDRYPVILPVVIEI